MSATSGRDAAFNEEWQGDVDAKGFKLKNADLSQSTNVPGTVPTIATTSAVLKGDNAGNAVAAIPLQDYWDQTVAFTGANSSKGLVPDPGATADNTYFLSRDLAWRKPAGTGVAPTIASTTVVLKGDNAGNAVAATAKTDFWDTTNFVASGVGHAKGLVPDPGGSAATTKFLREDSTWAVPPASSGVTIAVTSAVIKGDGAGGGVAATPGTDFVAPSTALTRLLAVTTPLSTATPTVNWATTTTFSQTLAANTTYTFSNDTDGWDITIAITNTVGNYTVTWPAGIKWVAATAPTQTVGAKTDLVGFKKIGTIIYGAIIQNLS